MGRSQQGCSGQAAPQFYLPTCQEGAGVKRSLKYWEHKLAALQHLQRAPAPNKKAAAQLPMGVGPGGCMGAGEGPQGSMWVQAGAPGGWFAWEQGPLGPVLGNIGAQKLQLGMEPMGTPGLVSSPCLAPRAPVNPPAAWRCFPTLSLGLSICNPGIHGSGEVNVTEGVTGWTGNAGSEGEAFLPARQTTLSFIH